MSQTRFFVVTAFDAHYEVGFLCSTVNEAYCQKHGYGFRCVVPSPTEMDVLSGHRHSAWGKVALLLHLLGGQIPSTAAGVAGSQVDDFDYVVWIDADAMVLDHNRKLEDFVDASSGADFIIGEDMADTDFLNTGLFFCKTHCHWMRTLVQHWWDDSDAKWHHEVCWDQTGLCRLLESEGVIGNEKPWFSWQGGKRRKKCGQHTFIFDCGSFNFKYVNNCEFVFHAVGEKELLYSFARVLSLKRERLYLAVQEGFINGGMQMSSTLHHQYSGNAEVALKMKQAHAFWSAHGVGSTGRRGRPPPISWQNEPSLAICLATSLPEVMVISDISAAPAVKQCFVGGHTALVVQAAFCNETMTTASGEQLSISRLGMLQCDSEITLLRCAPMRGVDVVEGRMVHISRMWQLCEYIAGRPTPLNPLCFTSDKTMWRACGWKPWGSKPRDRVDSAFEKIARWRPAFLDEGCQRLVNMDGSGELDLEPPGAETRVHRALAGAHALFAVLEGIKEFIVFPKEDSCQLLPGVGTCDPDQSPCDLKNTTEWTRLLTCTKPQKAILHAGDVLLLPSGWWCWSQARTGTMSLRRLFTESRVEQLVQQQVQRVQEELRATSSPAPRLVRTIQQAQFGGHQESIVWLEQGEGSAASHGHFAALHFVVYAADANVLENSRLAPHPMVIKALPPVSDHSHEIKELSRAPIAIQEVRRRGLLLDSRAKAGARCGFAVHRLGGSRFVVVQIIEVLKQRADGSGLQPVACTTTKNLQKALLPAAGPLKFSGWQSTRYIHGAHSLRLVWGIRRSQRLSTQ